MKHSSKLETAQALYDSSKGDEAFALYDPNTDGASAPWLAIAAAASLNPTSENFDILRAIDLALIAAIKGGDSRTFEVLAYLSQHYTGERRDPNASVAWYEANPTLSERLSKRCRQIAEIFLIEDRRFGVAEPNDATAYVLEKLDCAIQHGNPIAAYLKGHMYLCGRGIEKDSKLGLSLLWTSLSYSLLGPADSDIDSALSLLLTYTLIETNPDTAFDEAQKIYKQYESFLGTGRRQPWDDLFSIGNVASLRSFISDCLSVSYGKKDWSALERRISKDAATSNFGPMYKILQTFWMSSNWLQSKTKNAQWRKILLFAENKHCGVSHRAVRQSTERTGPRYNAVTADGRSILGAWAAAPVKTSYGKSSYVPRGGAQMLLSIRTDAKGIIRYETARDVRLPAKLLLQDFHVAEAIVFGQRDYLADSTFSLPALVTPQLASEDLRRKRWKPHWLGHTDFGKTLYVVDSLAARFSFDPFSLVVSSPQHAVHEALPEQIKNFLQTLRHVSGLPSSWSHMRLMVLSEDPKATPDIQMTKNGTKLFSLSNISVNVLVDGEECSLETKKTHTLNDPTYRMPRITTLLTKHYELLKLCAPVFARAEELLKLFDGLLFLREMGYTPSALMADRIEKRLARYEALPSIPEKNLLCSPDYHTFKY